MSHENAKQPGADKVAGEKDQEPVTAKQPGGKKNEEFSMFAPEVSSEFLRSLINGSDDAIISKSFDGKITGWNPAAEKIFGYKSNEIIGAIDDVESAVSDTTAGSELIAETVEIGNNINK